MSAAQSHRRRIDEIIGWSTAVVVVLGFVFCCCRCWSPL
jgi:hypothetical protein